MGWHTEISGPRIYVRLDEHGGDKERRHAALRDELFDRARKALEEIAADPKYAEISAEVWD